MCIFTRWNLTGLGFRSHRAEVFIRIGSGFGNDVITDCDKMVGLQFIRPVLVWPRHMHRTKRVMIKTCQHFASFCHFEDTCFFWLHRWTSFFTSLRQALRNQTQHPKAYFVRLKAQFYGWLRCFLKDPWVAFALLSSWEINHSDVGMSMSCLQLPSLKGNTWLAMSHA